MATRCKTAILISGSGTNLQAFIDRVDCGALDLELSVVFSNRPDAYGLVRARDAGIPTACIEHGEFADRRAFDRAVAAKLDEWRPNLLVLAGFMRILSPAFVTHYAGRILNIHPALLPAYPGLNTHQRVLDAGDRWHGSTVHFVTEQLDSGPRILQGRLPVTAGETADQLAARVQALQIPGVYLQREYRRYYPGGEVTAHIVGFTNIDDEGQEGLELAFNHWLAGESGSKRVLKDRLGRSIENVESIRPPHHGKDLRTSIDLRLQYLSYRTLKSAIKAHNARSGSIVVLDVRTGEVLAMVNQPTYNPNDRSQFTAERYRNRAITDIFEPGSSLKPLVVAAALESGQYRPSSVVDTAPGFIVIGPKKIEDTRNLGRVSLTTILGDDDALRSR